MKSEPAELSQAQERFSRFFLGLLDQKIADLSYPRLRAGAMGILKEDLANINYAVSLGLRNDGPDLAAVANDEYQLLLRLLAESGEDLRTLIELDPILAAFPQNAAGSGRAVSTDHHNPYDEQARLFSALRERMNYAAQNAYPLAILVLHLDAIPAAQEGIAVLVELEQRLRRSLRSHDRIFKLDNAIAPQHSFALIIDYLTRPSDAEFVAIKVLRSLLEPFGTLSLKGDIGIGLYPMDSNSPEGLLLRTEKTRFALAEPETGCYILAPVDLDDHLPS